MDGTHHRAARSLYDEFREAVAYVAVETPDAGQSIGTAFHIGNSIWVTARHVVEHSDVLEVGCAGRTSWASHPVEAPFLHPDPLVDVAALDINGTSHRPAIPLGGWLDDWLDDGLILERSLVMGYPPIPFAREPLLVATSAEVTTVLDKRQGGHPHFILSAMARGGFSGAPAITSFGETLGVVTETQVNNASPVELGYLAVLSIEPIFVCLKHHGIIPPDQAIAGVFDA